MIYLDYSATTPVNDEVLTTFMEVEKTYFGNSNSIHLLGIKAKELIDAATKQIAKILGVNENEVIYTSGASESNNLAIKGVVEKSKIKHIITTNLEHSSIYGPLSYLQKQGCEITFLKLVDGLVDLDDLREKLKTPTCLVTIASVNSELGIIQNIDEIGKIIKENSNALFHVDATQSIGKKHLSFKNVDLISFSAHKFYGLKGIGVLIKKGNVDLEPLIHGGRSTTVYRSGTPATALIASTAKALRLAYNDLEQKYDHVLELSNYLKQELAKYEKVSINSINHIPHILNISIENIKVETFIHAMEEYNIYISTKSACSKSESSRAVFEITQDYKKALSSIRISLSHLTTKEEVNLFLEKFKICYERLG